MFTRDVSGATSLYLDGSRVANGITGGDFSNWGDYALGLANEPNPALGTRPWLGELHLVAIYDRALEQDQVRRNFDAGIGTAVNHPPEALDDDVTVSEGGTIDTAAQGLPGLLENDYDPDGDTLAAGLIGDVTHGTLNLAADGSFVYTHDGSEVVADSFSYEANDGNGGSDVAVVSITIVPANDPPTAVDDEYAVAAGTAIDTAASGLPGVLENDSEPDGHPLRATLMDSVDHGTLDLNADGSFVYTHDGSDTASDSFTYEADDGLGGVDSAVVNIAISRANSAPTAADDNYSVDVGGTLDTLVQDLPGVLDNDADVDGDALTATLLTNPAHGTLTLSPDGSFTYTHDGSQNSADGFTYEVTDGNGGFDQATVTIQLHGTRVTEGLLVLYSFEESAGETLHDVSGVGTPLDLTIQDPANTEWISGGGLAIKEETVVTSIGPARKIVYGAMATQELTVETWVKPANTRQYGPARIVALSEDAYPKGGNFVLGQGPDAGDVSYDARLRTTETDKFGIPSLTSPDGSLTTNLTHVVFTREASGATRLYLDGALVATGTSGGNFSAWGDYALGLANEPDPALGNRPWLGELYLVAVYERALDEAEVLRNFDVGLD
jgi:VCBS repeat-containing protein